jgi:predicted alpha/beta superfamily hydrolase
MKQLLSLCFLLLCLLQSSMSAAQDQPPSPYVVADVVTIHSKVLNEDRKLFIYNPDSVGGNVLPAYPVLYLLEENDMPMVAGAVKYLSSYNEQLPAMLVVGIDSGGKRIRDLTPTRSLYDNLGNLDTDPNSWLSESGGGEKFLRFVREEVMPYIEQRYRTAPFKILAGHSVGGLASINALAADPGLFNAHLAVSPSLWWDRGAMLPAIEEKLSRLGPSRRFLFVADSPETGPFHTYMNDFLQRLQRAPGTLEWTRTHYPSETHGSVAAKAYYDGLRFLYPRWNGGEGAESAAAIMAHYRQMSERLGYDVQPPLGLVNDWNFPANPGTHIALADAYARSGAKADAINAYRDALRLAPTDRDVAAKIAALEAGG